MKEEKYRQTLTEFLRQGPAHLPLKDILTDIKAENRHKRFAASVHTIWEELEHLRIAQEDILRYTLDPSWRSPDWPQGYWPADTTELSENQWQKSIASFLSDLEEVCILVEDASKDLMDNIPHGQWRTYLREILLIIDHNAYHLGQIVQLRKLLGDWPA
jgi:uncharacterized damage-inducible protein DinB